MLSVRPDRPLDSLTLRIMREVDALIRDLGRSYFLCGAIARDILLQHVNGIETGAATIDIDFGVSVESWEQFEKIKAQLIATGRFEATKKMSQRLYYKTNAENRGYPLDIIPFGGIEKPPHSITWPLDRDIAMNVIGYEEALATALEVEVESGFVVPVISLPGLTLLKLFAWADRGFHNSKDARDLLLLFRQYANAGNEDRLYGEEAIGIMAGVEYDFVLAGTQLLGGDVRAIAAKSTREQIVNLIGDPTKMDKLLKHIAASIRDSDDPIEIAERYLEQFKSGLRGK